ncbi:MAG: deoxyuridine 5'-triphosphate nucleotidohydrolase [Nitrososphaerota archaeon]
MTCLSDKEILKKIMSENPLIKDYINLEEQIQPAGFDLTLNSVYSISSQGEIYDSSIKEDILPNYEEVKTINGLYNLNKGAYLIIYNEIINLPNNLMALVYPRSTLIRMGATIYTAIWDPGYNGRGRGLLNVFNEKGIILRKNSRIAQIVFFKLMGNSQKIYSGKYKGEGL